MPDDITDIKQYYDASVASEETRLHRHQLERDVTRRYLEDYLPTDSRVLEIGAATGSYTVWLAGRGHRVTAVDLSGAILQRCRSLVEENGFEERVDCLVADARDLSFLPSAAFDAVLLMGPLYHLVLEADRVQALTEACKLLKPNGVIFSAFISRVGIWGHTLKEAPAWIDNEKDVRSVLEFGRDSADHPEDEFRAYYATVDEIAPLHERVGFQTLCLAGVEPAISTDDDSYNSLQGERRKLWLDLLYELSSVPSLVASSRHLLYIGRKP